MALTVTSQYPVYTDFVGLLSEVPSDQRRAIYDDISWQLQENYDALVWLEGDESSVGRDTAPPIITKKKLSIVSGATLDIEIEYPHNAKAIRMGVNDGDTYTNTMYDTHGGEVALTYDKITITPVCWATQPLVTTPIQMQATDLIKALKLNQKSVENAALNSCKQKLSCILGEAFIVQEYNGNGVFDTVAELEANEYCRNQIVANAGGIGELGSDDKFQLKYIRQAGAQLYTGWSYSGVASFRAKKPFALGKAWKGIVLTHEFVLNHIQESTEYFSLLKDADPRGDANRSFAGLSDGPALGLGSMFEWDGYLIVTLTGEVGDMLLFDRGDTIYDKDGTAVEAGCNGCKTIVLAGGAVMRGTVKTENFQFSEWWDGFAYRNLIRKYQGMKAALFPIRAASATLAEMGRSIIYTAAEHPVNS